jgi:hypothetical protein
MTTQRRVAQRIVSVKEVLEKGMSVKGSLGLWKISLLLGVTHLDTRLVAWIDGIPSPDELEAMDVRAQKFEIANTAVSSRRDFHEIMKELETRLREQVTKTGSCPTLEKTILVAEKKDRALWQRFSCHMFGSEN